MSNRSQAIECMADAVCQSVDGEPCYCEKKARQHFDALEAAGFEILRPGELQQVGWDCVAHGFTTKVGCVTYKGDNRECSRTPLYVRTDGGDAS